MSAAARAKLRLGVALRALQIAVGPLGEFTIARVYLNTQENVSDTGIIRPNNTIHAHTHKRLLI